MHDKNLRMEKFIERGKKRLFKDVGKGIRLEKGEVGPGEQTSLQSSKDNDKNMRIFTLNTNKPI